MALMTALAIGALATTVAGTVVRAKGQKKAGAEAQRVAEWNAEQARQQGVDVQRRGAEEGNMLRREVRGIQGAQRAGYGGQGVDVGIGTPTALAGSTEALLRSDLDRIRRNAERAALGFKAEADEYTRQGKYAKSAANYNMWSTILGGAADSTLLASRMDWGSGAAGTSSPASSPASTRSIDLTRALPPSITSQNVSRTVRRR